MEKLLLALISPFTAAGPVWSLVVVLVLLFVYIFYHIFKTYVKQQNDYTALIQKIGTDHREDYQNIVKQMFEVVNKNTESNQELKDAVRDLRLVTTR